MKTKRRKLVGNYSNIALERAKQYRTDDVSKLIQIAIDNGFEHYGSFNEDEHQHEILTCIKGRYDGEVIDLYSEWYTGKVLKVEYSCQAKGQTPNFTFERFWDAQPILKKNM